MQVIHMHSLIVQTTLEMALELDVLETVPHGVVAVLPLRRRTVLMVHMSHLAILRALTSRGEAK